MWGAGSTNVNKEGGDANRESPTKPATPHREKKGVWEFRGVENEAAVTRGGTQKAANV